MCCKKSPFVGYKRAEDVVLRIAWRNDEAMNENIGLHTDLFTNQTMVSTTVKDMINITSSKLIVNRDIIDIITLIQHLYVEAVIG
jgi:hypothetical protein